MHVYACMYVLDAESEERVTPMTSRFFTQLAKYIVFPFTNSDNTPTHK